MLLLKVASVACVVVGYRAWRWYCRRAHQGLQTEEQQHATKVALEQQLLEDEEGQGCTNGSEDSARSALPVGPSEEARPMLHRLSTMPEETLASSFAEQSSIPVLQGTSPKCEDVSLRGFLSRESSSGPDRTASSSLELLFPSGTLPSSTPRPDRPVGLYQPAFAVPAMSTIVVTASREEVVQAEESKELGAPWPGLSVSPRVHEEEVSMQWPGLDVSQRSTAEAEAVVFHGSSAPEHLPSPRWAGVEEESGDSPSPDSPLSLTQRSPTRARRSKRGRGRTYFNSSRSISSQESSPHAAAVAAASASSPFGHGLHTFVRSPRWADQQPGAARAAMAAKHAFSVLQSSMGSVSGIHGSMAEGDQSPRRPTPARSPLLQHKADATASWVAAAGTAIAAARGRLSPLPSPFSSAEMPARQPTTESTVSPSASSGRFARMRTLSAPEHRTREAKPQTSPTKSGAGGSPGEARLLSAQAAWAALGGSTSPSRHSAVNSPREAFQSMESLEPAPTEEGFYLGGQIEKVLSELKEDAQPVQLRRYSRSFSEPNLFQHFMKQMQGEDGEVSKEDDAASSEEEDEADEDRDGILTQLQSAMDAMEDGSINASTDRGASSELRERRQSGAEASTADSSIRSGQNGSAPGACNGKMSCSDSLKRSREESSEPPAPIRLDVTAGPCASQSYTLAEGLTEVTVGRLSANVMTVSDNEVSGHHVAIRWDPSCRCWQVMDLGSLNGSTLNGRIISTSNRRRGRLWRLNDGDQLQLGVHSGIKITYLPLADAPMGLSLAPKPVLAPTNSLLTIPTLRSKALVALAPQPDSERASRLLTRHSGLRLEAWFASCTGREHARMGQDMEDVGGCEEALLGAAQPAVLCSIFDGHCGRGAAEEALTALPAALAERLPAASAGLADGSGAGAAWQDAFQEADRGLRSEEGCTATAILAWLDAQGSVCLQAANVGDSAAYFARVPVRRSCAPHILQLTGDHRYTNPKERERLAGMGIRMGPKRTRLYGLNLSRCLGDKFLKDQDLGLSAVPHVSDVVCLEPAASGVVVLASDGLWDVADGDVALKVALAAHAESGGSAQAMAESLLAHAQKQRSKDDISIIAITVSAAATASTRCHSNGS
ncbi:probable protein kinase and PP2C-like domain-containing protein at C-terminar half [Coccomyxa sp. Obi]|nr:probable protein kinase and PP2C-like domain-containing protein at C-terminar half [Coccomyxa sp. Obi]